MLATTVRASFATTISWYSMPLAAQAAFSSSLIGREAFEIWVWPSQNFLKPPPVPEVPTVMLTPVFSVMNSSAAAEVSGPTVLEPSEAMAPLSGRAAAGGAVGAARRPAAAAGGQGERAGQGEGGGGAETLDLHCVYLSEDKGQGGGRRCPTRVKVWMPGDAIGPRRVNAP